MRIVCYITGALEGTSLTTDRYTVIYDESDFILDNETGEYYCIEEACNLLNDIYDRLETDNSFFKTIAEQINKQGK